MSRIDKNCTIVVYKRVQVNISELGRPCVMGALI